jgi:hypothetical protein
MPYIKDREKYSLFLSVLKDTKIENSGDLNYLITKLINRYIKIHGERYQFYNDILGALEGSKLETYRLQISEYENVKKAENGTVWEK